MSFQVYIGYEEREDLAYQVCRRSIEQYGTYTVPLNHRELRKAGLFWREWRIDSNGQYWDAIDGKPFSTQFSHSRFLTQHIAKQAGHKWALFCDCDFMFRTNPAALLDIADPSKAVMVVKHDQRPTEAVKMDGVKQVSYPRKNWSSLILFNVGHEANARLTPECVNEADGSWLHQFGWLSDDLIGELPAGWNHLVGVNPDPVMAAHFTLGGPWFEQWPKSSFDNEWRSYARDIRHA